MKVLQGSSAGKVAADVFTNSSMGEGLQEKWVLMSSKWGYVHTDLKFVTEPRQFELLSLRVMGKLVHKGCCRTKTA